MKLSPEARDAMLAEYESGADPLPVLAERWSVSLSTINTYRRRAGLSGRSVVNRDLIPVEPVVVLPVYPMRLVSRPSTRPGYDHDFEPGAYGVCRRCGEEKHGPAGSRPKGGDDGRS